MVGTSFNRAFALLDCLRAKSKKQNQVKIFSGVVLLITEATSVS